MCGVSGYLSAMKVLCLVGRHKPSPVTIARAKAGHLIALCDGCGIPLELRENGDWKAAAPLIRQRH